MKINLLWLALVCLMAAAELALMRWLQPGLVPAAPIYALAAVAAVSGGLAIQPKNYER